MDPVRVSAEEAHRAFAAGGVQLVDVREGSECDAERVEGALNAPLSRFDALAGAIDPARPVYLLCRSGARASDAASRLLARGHASVFVVEGGLSAWAASGLPVARGVSRVWAMERQVRFGAGSLVLLGVALGLAVDARWLGLSAFVGGGLVFSALTDTCGMAVVLGRMPWNRGCGPRR
jgi:rhodanese-related sulfurtransferase